MKKQLKFAKTIFWRFSNTDQNYLFINTKKTTQKPNRNPNTNPSINSCSIE